MSSNQCCVITRGDVFIGPALKTDGTGYENAEGWGYAWGQNYGGFVQPAGTAGSVGMPPSRPLGEAQVSWTPVYETFSAPIRFGLSDAGSCGEEKRLDYFDVNLDLFCLSRENRKMIMGARSISGVSSSFSNENLNVSGSLASGLLIPVANAPIDSNQAYSLQTYNIITGAVVAVLVDRVDYKLSPFGVRLVKPIVLPPNVGMRVSYASTPSTALDAYCNPCLTCSILIETSNIVCGNSGNGQKYEGQGGYFFPRVKLYHEGENEMFQTTEFQNFTMSGKAYKANLSGCLTPLRLLEIT